MWARIDDTTGRCAEFTDRDPAGRFHPSLRWEPVAEALADWADTAYVAAEGGGVAPPSLDYLRDQAKARVAARRYRAEVGGITMPDGSAIRTDRDSQALVAGAKALAEAEPDEPVDFKAASGWVTLPAPTVIAIGLAVGRHVRACFRRERAISDLIDAAASAAEVVAVYAAEVGQGWPESV